MASQTLSSEPAVKVWANSGDSHYLEPDGLWEQILPKHFAERMPRTERISDTEEVIHVDGQSFTRETSTTMSRPIKGELRGEQVEGSLFDISHRPAGSRDPHARLADLDAEGVWGEVIYPSIGIWAGMLTSPELIRVAFRAVNEWRLSEVQRPRAGPLGPRAEHPVGEPRRRHGGDQVLRGVGVPRRRPGL